MIKTKRHLQLKIAGTVLSAAALACSLGARAQQLEVAQTVTAQQLSDALGQLKSQPKTQVDVAAPSSNGGTTPEAGNVQAPGVPTINTIEPDRILTSNSPTLLTVYGKNFIYDTKVNLHDVTDDIWYRDRAAIARTPTEIAVNVRLGNVARDWTAELVNPDGSSSGEIPFKVLPAPKLERPLVQIKAAKQWSASTHNPETTDSQVSVQASSAPVLSAAALDQALTPQPANSGAASMPSTDTVVGGDSETDQPSQQDRAKNGEATQPVPSGTQSDDPSRTMSAPPSVSASLAEARGGDTQTPTAQEVPSMGSQGPVPAPPTGVGTSTGSQFSSPPAGSVQAAIPSTVLPSREGAGTRFDPVNIQPQGFAPLPAAGQEELQSRGAYRTNKEHQSLPVFPASGTAQTGQQPWSAAPPVDYDDPDATPTAEAQTMLDAGVDDQLDQRVLPETITPVVVSNRDVNRIACDGNVQDAFFSQERPMTLKIAGSDVYVKFKIRKLGDHYTFVDQPVDLHIVCDNAVYTLILHPNKRDSVTVRLAPSMSHVTRKITEEWSALPLEAKIQRFTLMVYQDELPDGFQRHVLADPDPHKHIVLIDPETGRPLPGLGITGLFEVNADGTGLEATEYRITTNQAREFRETDFLSSKFGAIVGVTIDPLRVAAGQSARLIIVSRSAAHGN